MLRLIMSHIHQEGIKSFSAYVIEESGRSRANLSGRFEMVWEGKEERLGTQAFLPAGPDVGN